MNVSANLRLLPGIDQIKQYPVLATLLHGLPDSLTATAIRNAVAELRAALLASESAEWPIEDGKLPPDLVAEKVRQALATLLSPSLVPLFNATGVVIHTNLGRAPLGLDVWQQMTAVATGYSNLEYDLKKGARGSRHQHFELALRRLAGAEACLVVNNNAAAVLLVLTALARGREVIVSRGELIEIGGSFRIPDIMAQGGAVLRAVGTTNRTWLKDYEGAIGTTTGLLMKAHRSNFSLTGFTQEVTRLELTGLAKESGLPFYEDLGSGLMTDLSAAGIASHDQVSRVLADGVDIVSFSGDKMLGGPQAGIIAGRADLIATLKRHPLTRALRPDKMTLAGLEAVALAYLRGDEERHIPVVAMLREPTTKVRARARGLARKLNAMDGIEAAVVATVARVGGGAEPERTVPSAGLRIQLEGFSETQLEQRLRRLATPIIARREEGRVVLDLRTILPHQSRPFANALIEALTAPNLP
jgi:L-seryl-tRNA(Ser) seleniumtransferase